MKIKLIIFSLLFSFNTLVQAQDIIINEVMSSNYQSIQDDDGDYSDWIEIYNCGDIKINLSDYSLSDDINSPQKWIFPNIDINPDAYLLIFASGKNKTDQILHTNFKISATGEKLWLRDSFGNVVDSLDSISIPTDISLGRSTIDPADWVYFSISTPGNQNNQSGLSALCNEPIFSLDAGFYNYSVDLKLTSENENSIIYYSTDGSAPNINSNQFETSILIDKTTVIKARCIVPGMLASKIITKTYFVNEDITLPIISLSTDPENLWDEENGIYVDGINGITGSCSPEPKNYNQDWEKPINIEFFETDKSLAFNILAGVKIYGGCSRTYPQKSLAIYARRKYGYKSIDYPIFPQLPFKSYEAFVLRNSGDDYYASFMRDALMHNIVDDLDLETQAYRPSVVFLNGEFWGIHNIREKINENYIAQHHDVDPDNIDLLEKNKNVIAGDAVHYNNMLNYIENNDLSVEENYHYIKSQMDTENFIAYSVSQIYFDNTDWPGHNIKYWRSRDGGKWRWILYDTDFGFGFKSAENYMNNTLEFATTPNGEVNANQPWATYLLRKLLENAAFKRSFINTYADYSNTIFRPEIVNEKITNISSIIQPEIPKHIKKWGEVYPDNLLYIYWQNTIKALKNFSQNRLSYLNDHFINKFNLTGNSILRITPNIIDFGRVKINSVNISKFPWDGKYFNENLIKIEVITKPGYKFIGWSKNGSIFHSDNNYELELSEDLELNLIFEIDSVNYNNIVINEINYKSTESFNSGDWIEITNIGTTSQDLSGWLMKDENGSEQFIFPINTIIKPNDYLVIVEDSALFRNQFPNIENFTGNLGFKINNEGELLQLINNNNFVVDSVRFTNITPWPIFSFGTGSTLELNQPNSDNSIATNWHSSSILGGTPGTLNSEDNLTSKEKFISDIPLRFALNQNYPNPFNPSTIIKYEIPNIGSSYDSRQQIKLMVYDVLGNLLIILVDQLQNAGTFNIEFDGSKFSSGVYYYQLRSGNFVQTKKMLLIK